MMEFEPMFKYFASEARRDGIYATDRTAGDSLHINVAMSKHEMEVDRDGGWEQHLTERKLDELGIALVRELRKQAGKYLLVEFEERSAHKNLVPEFLRSFTVKMTELRRMK